MGDVEGAQKMVKMYDMLMKSGKFTASQNKAENGEVVDSISEIVAICEKDGFIPRYYTDGPQDKVDRTLQDLQAYTRTLITEEMNLGNLIENAVKQMSHEENKDEDELTEGEDMSLETVDSAVISDDAFSEFGDFMQDEEEADLSTYMDLSEREDADGTTGSVITQ